MFWQFLFLIPTGSQWPQRMQVAHKQTTTKLRKNNFQTLNKKKSITGTN